MEKKNILFKILTKQSSISFLENFNLDFYGPLFYPKINRCSDNGSQGHFNAVVIFTLALWVCYGFVTSLSPKAPVRITGSIVLNFLTYVVHLLDDELIKIYNIFSLITGILD